MKAFTWHTKKHGVRWTLFVGKCGRDDYAHRFRLWRLDVERNEGRNVVCL